MASTVLTRPTHYDTLGIEPSASLAEIERAFAWGVSPFRPKPIGGVAQVSIAYQTLRDPERRRAYDQSIGIVPEPKPAPRPLHSGASFRVAAPLHPAERLAAVAPAPPPPAPERAVGSFIAASLRAPSAPLIEPPSEPEAAVAAPPPPVETPRTTVRAPALPEDEAGETGINRTALGVGGAVLAVIMIGAWAGLEAGDPGDAGQAKAELSTALPKARPVTSAAAAEPAPSETEAVPQRRPLAFASLRTRHARPAIKPAATEASPPAHHNYYETTGADGTPEIAVADEPAATGTTRAEATPASMPLPNRVVARTIQKIGYPCGAVASTSAVDGAPGVFNVTCTSGHSYRAAPVHGRYRFRRSS
jgi:hypothetical protein